MCINLIACLIGVAIGYFAGDAICRLIQAIYNAVKRRIEKL